MLNSVSFTLALTDPRLPAVLNALGLEAPVPSAISSAPLASPVASMDEKGLALIDDRGIEVLADPRNASGAYISALRLMASKSNVSVDELVEALEGTSLSAFQGAATKRVQRIFGGKRGAALYVVDGDKVLLADTTREALGRHFGFLPH